MADNVVDISAGDIFSVVSSTGDDGRWQVCKHFECMIFLCNNMVTNNLTRFPAYSSICCKFLPNFILNIFLSIKG